MERGFGKDIGNYGITEAQSEELRKNSETEERNKILTHE